MTTFDLCLFVLGVIAASLTLGGFAFCAGELFLYLDRRNRSRAAARLRRRHVQIILDTEK